MNLEEIKAQYPPEHINALGRKDMDNIRALISEVERLSCEVERLQAVYELISTLSHVCGGRECIGYRLPGDSATQYRCNLCSAMREAMGIGTYRTGINTSK